jgi:acetate kinase
VHGGERFKRPTLVNDAVLDALRSIADLAPLHNPANIRGIEAAREALPDVPHVAVFDTAFHATMPPKAYRYAVPRELYERHGVRKYGFHGTSHAYVAQAAAERMQRPLSDLKIITLHLGNGASAAALDGGMSIDTSMGMTPLDGLIMGTRSGAIDPGVLLHLLRHGYTPESLDELLNRASGLLGLSGVSNDLRDVQQAVNAGHPDAQLALDAYAYRIKTTVGAYAAALGGLDAIVFTGGVGENNPVVREGALSGLDDMFGVRLDREANNAANERIHDPTSRVAVWVIPTHEEAMIATWTAEAVREERT